MPIQLRVMSWNIQKKRTNAAFLAEMMRVDQIDICVLLEVPNSLAFTIPFNIMTALNNLPTAYFAGQWQIKSVNVGNEAVSYIWHQNAAVGANAFVAENYANIPLPRAGKVVRNAAHQMIYFPTTNFRWNNVAAGRPLGRRPAYMSFVTNDGVAARRFTVLNLHTPFNVNTMIQSYATHLYASSREIMQVQRIDPGTAANTASLTLVNDLAPTVDPVLAPVPVALAVSATIRTRAVNDAQAAIQSASDDEAPSLNDLFAEGWNEGVNGAVKAVGTIVPATVAAADVQRVARACAMAGAGAAVRMVAQVALPTAPVAATANAAAALAEVQNQILLVVGQYAHPTPKKTAARIRDSIRTEAKRMVRAALAASGLTFPAPPMDNVDCAIVAGDFNVDFPDATGYSVAAQGVLGGNDAYAALTAIAGPARIASTTTRTGPTAFEGARIYTLALPTTLQNTTPALTTYVPINFAAQVANPSDFMGNTAWINGLKALPRTVGWNVIENAPYPVRIFDAFHKEVIDDTSFYRASAYDNIFVRGGAFNMGAMLDGMSALGSWPARAAAVANPVPALAVNPWPAANGALNALAQAQLGLPGANLQFTYSGITYNITPLLANAEEAAVFYDRFMSDHLPVAVGVSI